MKFKDVKLSGGKCGGRVMRIVEDAVTLVVHSGKLRARELYVPSGKKDAGHEVWIHKPSGSVTHE